MKQYSEIYKIITEQLGHTDLKTYQVAPKRTTPISPEDIALLSPDEVDCHDFWRVCKVLFGSDAVCNQAPPLGGTKSLLEANRRNLRLAWFSGALGWAHGIMQCLPQAIAVEIGPGYGSFKHFAESHHTTVSYYGFDVCPLTEDVLPMGRDGTFTEGYPVNKADFVYSSNVFQHLSPKQRLTLYRQIYEMLKPGGSFIFNLLIDLPPPKDFVYQGGARDKEGRGYMQHYGQYTQIPTFDEVTEPLRKQGFILNSHQIRQADYLTSFFWEKPFVAAKTE